MRQKRLFVLMSILLLGGLAGLIASPQSALAAERTVQFKDAGCQ